MENGMHTFLALFLLTLLGACNSSQIAGSSAGPVDVGQTSTSGTGSGSSSNSSPQTAMPVDPDAGIRDERVTPPQQVSGAQLTCTRLPQAEEPISRVKCSLYDAHDSKHSLDPRGIFSSFNWTYLPSSEVTISIVDSDAGKAAIFVVEGSDQAARDAYLAGANFSFEGRFADGTIYSSRVSSPNLHLAWLPGDHRSIPENAVKGGTGEKGSVNLYICQVKEGDSWILGKLHNKVDAAIPVCMTSRDGQGITSAVESTGEILRPYEILVSDAQDQMEWVPAGANAFGLSLSVDSFSCRSQESGILENEVRGRNDPKGEATPGSLRFGSSSCEYYFFGERSSQIFEVLSWKAGAFAGFSGNFR